MLPEARTRRQLIPAETLIIANPPPGRAELLQALRIVQPRRVVLLALPSGSEGPAEFIKSLAGMLRYALRAKGGQVSLSALATALSQRTAAVEAGLRWLAARGYIHIQAESLDEFTLLEGGQPDADKAAVMEAALRSILQETAAFRAFYSRAAAEELLQPD